MRLMERLGYKTPEEIVDELKSILAQAEGGSITPEVILSAVEDNPNHPLRQHLEWNDTAAARAQRLDTLELYMEQAFVEVDPPRPSNLDPTKPMMMPLMVFPEPTN